MSDDCEINMQRQHIQETLDLLKDYHAAASQLSQTVSLWWHGGAQGSKPGADSVTSTCLLKIRQNVKKIITLWEQFAQSSGSLTLPFTQQLVQVQNLDMSKNLKKKYNKKSHKKKQEFCNFFFWKNF